MAITLKDVAELEEDVRINRKKLEEQKAALEEQESALRVLKTMITDSASKTSSSKIILEELPPSDPTKRSLEKRVLDIVLKLDDQEFEVSQIEEQLKMRDELPKSQTPRASIAMALQKLEAKGEVIRTYKGVGSEPHRFKKGSTNDVSFY